MNILIIYAHPNHQSFNGAILQQVKNHLNSKHQVQILDLYAEKFDPLLRFDEEHLRRNLDKDSEMKKYRQLISWADHLIWIFPIWWWHACHPQGLYRPCLCFRFCLFLQRNGYAGPPEWQNCLDYYHA